MLLGGCFHADLPWLRQNHVATLRTMNRAARQLLVLIPNRLNQALLLTARRVTRATLLLRGGWYRMPAEGEAALAANYAEALPSQSPSQQSSRDFHYRHEGVEQLAARPPADDVERIALLDDSDRLTAANAASSSRAAGQ